MAKRDVALCLTLSGLTAIAVAQTAASQETWMPISPTAKAVTGRITFTPNEITFQNGKSLQLARGCHMLFRPEPKQRHVMADLYRITPPDDPILENGNRLCKGKPISYLIIWKPEQTGKEADPRGLAPFSGANLNPGSADDCGRYLYDAGSH